MIYKKANISNLNELIQMRIEYLLEDFGELSPNKILEIQNNLNNYFLHNLNKNCLIYIAKDDNIVSTAFLVITEKPSNPNFLTGRVGTVMNVYTKEEYRKQGIATRLMEMLLNEAKRLNLDYVELKSTKQGYTLYKKLGFKENQSKYLDLKYNF